MRQSKFVEPFLKAENVCVMSLFLIQSLTNDERIQDNFNFFFFRMKVNRRMAATRSMSQSEPDIPSIYVDVNSLDDDVIGFTEKLGGDDQLKNKEGKNESVKEKSVDFKQKQQQQQQKEIPIPLQTKSQPKEILDDFPSLPGSKAHMLPTNSKHRTEDFPALPTATSSSKSKTKKPPGFGNKEQTTLSNGIVIKSAKTKKKGKVKTNEKANEDFPSLSRPIEKSKPPPSKFNKFADNKHSQQTSSSSSSPLKQQPSPSLKQQTSPPLKQQNQPPKQPAPVKENRSRPPPGLMKGGEPSLQQHKQLMSERNMRLLGMLMKFLDEFNLNLFKDLSGKFRRGLIDANHYYKGISELLGENLKYIFSELVSLLPDEDKQSQLLQVHNDAKIEKKQKVQNGASLKAAADYSRPPVWGEKGHEMREEEKLESRCEKCGIVMSNDEIQDHLLTHGEAFPALPVTTKKKKNYSFSSSSRNFVKQTPARSAWGK